MNDTQDSAAMAYQAHLTDARRSAHWRALETMRQHERRALELQMARPTPKPTADTYQHWRGPVDAPSGERGLGILAACCIVAASGVAGWLIGYVVACWQYGL